MKGSGPCLRTEAEVATIVDGVDPATGALIPIHSQNKSVCNWGAPAGEVFSTPHDMAIWSSFLESSQRCTSERSATCRGTSGGGGGGGSGAAAGMIPPGLERQTGGAYWQLLATVGAVSASGCCSGAGHHTNFLSAFLPAAESWDFKSLLPRRPRSSPPPCATTSTAFPPSSLLRHRPAL